MAMANGYCSRCGGTVAPTAQFCDRCGTPVGLPEPTVYAPAYASSIASSQPPAYPPPYAAPSGRPSGDRRYSPALIVAVVALVLALAAGVTLIVVATRGDDSHKVASTHGPSAPASSTPTAAPAAVTTAAQPQVVTVTRSTTLAAPNPPGGGQAEVAPQTAGSLRHAYDSAVPVDEQLYSDGGSGVAFATPSGNIECFIYGDGDQTVQCAIARYDFPQPGPDCDNGAILSIDSGGGAAYSGCAYDPVVPGGVSLDYGSSVTFGGFGCVSRKSGVSCLDLDTDTGFTLSRQAFVPVN